MTKKKFSYSKSIQEIEKILNQIESGELDIDELAEKVKKATALIEECQSKLRATESELENILKKDDQNDLS